MKPRRAYTNIPKGKHRPIYATLDGDIVMAVGNGGPSKKDGYYIAGKQKPLASRSLEVCLGLEGLDENDLRELPYGRNAEFALGGTSNR